MPRASTHPLTPDGPLRAFIYDRNSRDATGLGTSVRDQGTENQRLCDMYGWVVVGRFQDPGRSASRYATRTRDDYDAMIKRLDVAARAKECDVLVLWEASRGYRNTRTYQDLRDLLEAKGILLCYNGRLYNMERSDDRYITGLDALNAEREADAIRDRNKRTHRLILERGDPPGRLPYGFTREYDPKSGALLRQVEDPAQAEVIRHIAQRVLAGHSCNSVARDLNARGVTPPWTSAAWTMESVKRVVVRSSTAGKREHDGRVVGDGGWPAILDEVTWRACRKLLMDPARLTHRDSEVKYLLSGLVFCGLCPGDVRMYSKKVSGAMSYLCRKCYRVSIRVPSLDALVIRAVLERVERPKFAASLVADGADEKVQLAIAQAQAYEAQLAEATALAGQLVPAPGGGLMSALSATRLAALEDDLLPKIKAARARAQDATVPQILRAIAGPQARTVWKQWIDAQDLGPQRAVIREVVRVSLNRGGMGARWVTPERYTLAWLR